MEFDERGTMPHATAFKFKVNDHQFETERETLTGLEIKTIAQVDVSSHLFLEIPGESRPDKQIGNAESVRIAEPGIEKFYTVPPATFGTK